MSDQARKTYQFKRYHGLLGAISASRSSSSFVGLLLHSALIDFIQTPHRGNGFHPLEEMSPLRAFTLHLHLHEDIFASS